VTSRTRLLLPLHRKGATRFVVGIGTVVLKFARHEYGARCNLAEADLYRTVEPRRQAMLCPVLWCSKDGWVLVARRASLLSPAEFNQLWFNSRRRLAGECVGGAETFPDWDYHPPDDVACPFEHDKPDDWGRINGRLVAVDYAGLVGPKGETEELRRNREG
jgi:hypothetical protein